MRRGASRQAGSALTPQGETLSLNQRYRRMLARGKTLQHTIVAIARELAGFVRAIGQRPTKPVA